MAAHAAFDQWTLVAGGGPVEIVPRAAHEQRVVLRAPLSSVRVGESAARAASASGYVVNADVDALYLGPHQALFAAAATVATTVVSVYVAPTEDDFLESGMLWHAPAQEEFHG